MERAAPVPRHPLAFLRAFVAAAFLLGLGVASCDSERKAIVSDKNTNWLGVCDDSRDCHAGLQCLSGLCTLACDVKTDCYGLAGAVCAPLSPGGACSASSDAPRGICTVPCSAQVACPRSGTSCAGGACVPSLCTDRIDAATGGPQEPGSPTGDAGLREAGTSKPDASIPTDTDAGTSKPDASIPADTDAGAGPGAATEAGAAREGGTFVPRIAPTALGNFFQLSLDVNALAADPVRDRVYAGTSGDDATYPRSLVTVDSQTGVVLDALPLDENPNSIIAISDDGSTLWVGSRPSQVDLHGTSPRVVKTGSASVTTGPHTLVALRGSSSTVAAVIDPGHRIAILDDLVARPAVFETGATLNGLSLGPDGHLFVMDSQNGLRHLVIDGMGVAGGPSTMPVTTTAAWTGAPPGDQLIIANEVWDVSTPASPRLSGRLPDVNRDGGGGGWGFFADTRTAWRFGSEAFAGAMELRIIDLATLTPAGRVALAGGVTDFLAEPVKTHSGGVAYAGVIMGLAGRALYILPRLPAEALTDSRNSRAHGSLVELPLAAEHLVADPVRHRLYATICGDADRESNRLVTIDATAGSVLNSVWVGSNPTALALSADGSTLWVSLEGSVEIRRVDLTTPFPTPLERYSLLAQTGARTLAEALFALPDGAGTIAMTLHMAYDVPDDSRILVVADDGKLRPTQFPPSKPVPNYSSFVRGPAGYVYGVDRQYGFHSIAITTEGPVGGGLAVQLQGSGGLTYDPAGFVYASGSVIDVRVPGSPALAGQLFGDITTPKPGTDIVFGLSSGDMDGPLVLRRGKRSTLTEAARATLGAEGDTFAHARDLVYLDADRVAFIAKAADATPASTRKRSSIWFSAVP
jgi:hypothetical protein